MDNSITNWKKILIHWVNNSKLSEKNVFSLEQTDINEFFNKFRLKVKEFPAQCEDIFSFLKAEYPDFELHLDDNNQLSSADYMYYYSLLLHYSCVKNPDEYFQKICQILPNNYQQAIASFFKSLLYKNINKTNLRRIIGDATPKTLKTLESPMRLPRPVKFSPPTPKTFMLEEKTRELHTLRALLDTEKYEKSFLENQIKQYDDKVKKLLEDKEKYVIEIKELRNNLLLKDTENSSPNKKYQDEQVKKRLRKDIFEKEENLLALKDKFNILNEGKILLQENLKVAEKEVRRLKEKGIEMEFRFEELKTELKEKEVIIQSLIEEKNDLEQFIKENRYSSNSRDANASTDSLDSSFTPVSTSMGSLSPENLGTSVIDLQLREKFNENLKLGEIIEQTNNDKNKFFKKILGLLNSNAINFDIDNFNEIIKNDNVEHNFTKIYEFFEEYLNKLLRRYSETKTLNANMSEKQNFLNNDIIKLKQECVNYKTDVETIEKDNIQLKLNIKNIEINFDKTKQNLEKLKSQFSELECKSSGEISNLKENIEMTLKKNKELVELHCTLKYEITELQKFLQEKQMEFENLSKVNTNLDRKLKEIEVKLIKKSEDLDESNRKCREIEIELSTKNEILNSQILDAVKDKENMEQEKKSFESKIKGFQLLEEKLNNINESHSTLEKKYETLSKNNENVIKEKNVLQRNFEDISEINADLNCKLKEIKEKLKKNAENFENISIELETKKEKFNIEMSNVIRERENLQQEKVSLSEKLISKANECVLLEEKLNNLDKSHLNLEKEYDELNQINKNVIKEKKDLQIKCEESNLKIVDLLNEIEILETGNASKNKEIEELNKNKKNLYLIEKSLKQNLDDLKKDLENQTGIFKENNEHLQNQQSKLKEEIISKNNIINKLKKDLKESNDCSQENEKKFKQILREKKSQLQEFKNSSELNKENCTILNAEKEKLFNLLKNSELKIKQQEQKLQINISELNDSKELRIELNNKLENLENERSKLLTDLEEINNKMLSEIEMKQNLIEKNNFLVIENEHKNSEIYELRAAIDHASKERELISDEIKILREQLNQSDSLRLHLEREIEKNLKNFESECNNFSEKISQKDQQFQEEITSLEKNIYNLKEELNCLTSKYDKICIENKNLIDEKEQSEREIIQFQNKISNLNETLKVSATKLDTCSRTCAQQEECYKENQQRCQQLEEELKKFYESYIVSQKQIASDEQMLNTLKSRNSNLELSLKEVQDQLKDISQEYHNVEKAKGLLEIDLNLKNAEFETITEKNTKLESDLNDEKEQTEKKISQFQYEISNLTETLKDNEAKLDNYRRSCAQQDKCFEENQQRYQQLEEEFKKLNESFSTSQEKIASDDKMLDTLKSRNSNLELSLKEVENQLKDISQEHHKVEEEKRLLEIDLNLKNAEFETIIEKNTKLESDLNHEKEQTEKKISQFQYEISNLTETLKDNEAKLDSYRRSCAQQDKCFEENQQRCQQLEEELKKLNESFITSQKQIASDKKILDTLKSRNSNLELSLKEVENQLKDISQEHHKVEEEKRLLKIDLNLKNVEFETITEKNTKLESDLNDEKEQTEKKISQFQYEISKLTETLKDNEAKLDNYRQSCAQQEEFYKENQQRSHQLEEELKKLNESFISSQKQIACDEKMLDTLKSRNSILELSLTEVENQLKDISQEHHNVKEEKRLLEINMNLKKSECEKITEKNTKLESDLNDEKEQTEKKISQFQYEISNLTETLKGHEAKLDTYRQTCAQQDKCFEENQQRYQQLEEEFKKLNESFISSQKQIACDEKMLDTLKSRNSNLELSLKEMENQFKNISDKYHNMEEAKRLLQINVNQKNVECEAINKQNIKLEADRLNLESKLEVTNTSLLKVENQIERINKEKNDLLSEWTIKYSDVCNKLNFSVNGCQSVREEFEQLKETLKITETTLEKEKKDSENEKNMSLNKISNLEKNLIYLENEIKSKNENNLRLEDELASLKEKFKNILIEKNDMEDNLEQNATKMKTTTDEITKLQSENRCLERRNLDNEKQIQTYKNNIKSFHDDIEKLESENNVIIESRNKLEDNYSQLNKKLEKTCIKLGQYQGNASKLEKENEHLIKNSNEMQSNLENIQLQNSKLQIEINNFKEKLEKTKISNKDLSDEKIELKEECMLLRTKLEESLTSELEMRKNYQKIQVAYKDAESRLKTMSDASSEISYLEMKNVELTHEIGSLNKTIEELKKINQNEQNYLENSLRNLKEENQNLLDINTNLNEEIKIVKADNVRLIENLNESTNQKQIMESKINKSDNYLNELQQNSEICELKCVNLQKENQKQAEEIINLQQNLQQTDEKEQIKDLMKTIENLESKVSKNMKDLESTSQKLHEQTDICNKLELQRKNDKEMIKHLENNCGIFEAKLYKSREQLAEVEKKWSKEKNQLMSENKFGEEKIKENRLELEGKLEKMKAKMRNLYNEEVDKLKSKYGREIFDYQAKIQVLESQTENYEAHIQKLSKQIFNLNGENSVLNRDKKFLETKLKDLEQFKNTSIKRPQSYQNLQNHPNIIPISTNQRITGNKLLMEDEEGELFNNTYLTELKEGHMSDSTIRDSISVKELQYRNSLAPPHLRSTYLAQYKEHNVTEEDIKDGIPVNLDDSLSSLLNGDKRKKLAGTTSYKRPGPPTPSKTAGRLSFGSGNEVQSTILKELNTDTCLTSKTPSKFRFFSSKLAKDEKPKTSVNRRNSLRFICHKYCNRQKTSKFQSSTPRKSRLHLDQQQQLENIVSQNQAKSIELNKNISKKIKCSSASPLTEPEFQIWRKHGIHYNSETSDSNSPLVSSTDFKTNRKNKCVSIYDRGNMYYRTKRTSQTHKNSMRMKSKLDRVKNFNKCRKSLNGLEIRKSILCRNSRTDSDLFPQTNAVLLKNNFNEFTQYNDDQLCDERLSFMFGNQLQHNSNLGFNYKTDEKKFENLLSEIESTAPFEVLPLEINRNRGISDFEESADRKEDKTPSRHDQLEVSDSGSINTILSKTLYANNIMFDRKLPNVNKTVVKIRNSSVYYKNGNLVLKSNSKITIKDLFELKKMLTMDVQLILILSTALIIMIFSMFITWIRQVFST